MSVLGQAAFFGPRVNSFCAICQDHFDERDVYDSPCRSGHLFHYACAKGWAARTPACPTCRVPWPVGDFPADPDERQRQEEEAAHERARQIALNEQEALRIHAEQVRDHQDQAATILSAAHAGNAEVRVDPNQAFINAARNGRTGAVRTLLWFNRVNPAADDNMAIQVASGAGHVDVVRLLLANDRVNPAANDSMAIQVASENGHVGVVRLLLADERVDPTANSNAALVWARDAGHAEVVRLLTERIQGLEPGQAPSGPPAGRPPAS